MLYIFLGNAVKFSSRSVPGTLQPITLTSSSESVPLIDPLWQSVLKLLDQYIVPSSGFLSASVDAILIAISITVPKLRACLRWCHLGMPLVCPSCGYQVDNCNLCWKQPLCHSRYKRCRACPSPREEQSLVILYKGFLTCLPVFGTLSSSIGSYQLAVTNQYKL